MGRPRMFWQLFGTFGVLLLCSLGLLGLVLSSRVERHEQDQIKDRLRTKAMLLRELVRDLPADKTPQMGERVKVLGKQIATRITLISEDGTVLADSDEEPDPMENHAHRPEVEEARDSGMGMATRPSNTLGKSMMYLALRAEEPIRTVGYVRVALPLDEINERVAELTRIIWSAAALTGVAGLALALWLARRITEPLHELTRGAAKIAAGQYGQKAYVESRDEMGNLAETFNHMSEQLLLQFTQLEQDRQQLRTILSGMVEGVVAIDAEERILFANERAATLLGFQSQAVVGRRIWELARQPELHEVVQKALQGAESCEGELRWDGVSGRTLAIHAVRLPGSPTRGAVVVLHDVSELRRLERVRQEFVANVSHELKTPLAVIKACIETLLDGAVDDAEHRGPFLERIGEQADRLHSLILDLLSLARIEAGTEAFELQAVALEPVVLGCVERLRARAEAKGQLLEAVPPEEPAGEQGDDGRRRGAASTTGIRISEKVEAWADEEAVNQILENLVDNALKYTPEGGRIWVRWSSEGDQACFEVEDTGHGIPEKDLPHIFERFFRVDKARSRRLGGTGLGLSIVKHLVQAMQGTVQASSRPGEGTIFRVRLPRALPG